MKSMENDFSNTNEFSYTYESLYTKMTYPLDPCALLFVVQCLLYLTVLSELALAKPLGDTLQTKAVFAFIMGIAVRVLSELDQNSERK
jgi:hypothetical protein